MAEREKTELEKKILELNRQEIFKYRDTKLPLSKKLAYDKFGWYADSIGEALWETNQKLAVILDELVSKNNELSEENAKLRKAVEELSARTAACEGGIGELSGRAASYESRFEEVFRRLDENNLRFDSHDKRLDENNLRFDSHDKRLDECNERFDAHDKRLDENNVRLDGHDKRLDECNERFDAHDKRLDECNERFDAHDKRLDECNERFDAHDKRLDECNKRLDSFDRHFDTSDRRITDIEAREEWTRERFDGHDTKFAEHIRWISKVEMPDISDFDYRFGDERFRDFPRSRLCTAAELMSDTMQRYRDRLCTGFVKMHDLPEHSRKEWEFEAITDVLDNFGMLGSGKRGVGFAVGNEPLSAYYASKGCEILATDLAAKDDKSGLWTHTDQSAMSSAESLNMFGICDKDSFKRLVTYRDVDMNHIPGDIRGYDFCWSSCAIEHIGGLEKSKAFLKNVLDVLKPGGISVHTTEINLDSNISTVTDGYSVIFRRCDIEEICRWMNENGHKMYVDFRRGSDPMDMRLCGYRCTSEDYPDFMLNCNIDGYDSTSFIFIIQKGT